MYLIELARIALGSLMSNRMRSLLATLGISIGIVAVSTLLSVGQSFQRFAQEQFAALDTNAITLMAQPDYSGGMPSSEGRLEESDLEAIADLPNVREVLGRYSQGGELRAGPNITYANLIGRYPSELRSDDRMAIGRFITERDIEERARVVVLNWSLAQMLYPDGRPLGRELIVQGLSFRVIGVQAAPEGISFFGDTAVVPISTARDRLFPQSAYSRVQVSEATIYLEDTTRISETEQAVAALLRSRHKLSDEQGNDFSFQNFREFAETNNNILVGITAFLGVIGGISLLVGGIGIMNIMLVSVTERTREIGLRKAVGARRRDILVQFLVEAIALSLLGGLTGVAITAVLVNSGAIVVQTVLSQAGLASFIGLDPSAVLLALGFASLVGLVAGIYPAFRASRLSPINALRAE